MGSSRLPFLATVTALIFAAAGCGGDDEGESPASQGGGAEQVTVAGDDALIWGDGSYGVVLAHGAAFDAESWEPQADRIASEGIVALAVEDTSPETILAAVEYLMNERDVTDVALLGGSAGADAILEAASEEPEVPDQLILLSPNQTVDGLGAEPKLFIASEDEPVVNVSRELAANSPGDQNEAQILPGDAHAQNIFDGDQGETVTRALLERLNRFSAD